MRPCRWDVWMLSPAMGGRSPCPLALPSVPPSFLHSLSPPQHTPRTQEMLIQRTAQSSGGSKMWV